MSILGKNRLRELMAVEQIEERLVVTPLLDEAQIGQASIDIRLGNDFIVTRRGNLASVDPAQEDVRHHRYQTRHYVNFGEPFYLHPHELVLTGTLEYFRLPRSVAGTVTSRSSWGRAGLVIATATAVHPGFTGTITLELVNLGEVPLVLYPGLPVAQLVLADCDGGEDYSGRFAYHTDAHFADIAQDKRNSLKFWVNSENHQ